LALSDNYLKVELASPHPPNRLLQVEIGGLTETGLQEKASSYLHPSYGGGA